MLSVLAPRQLYDLAAFEPTDEEICTATGQDVVMDEDDDIDETLGGFIVPDGDEDDDDFGDAVQQRKPKQPNRAIVQDSDDEDGDVAQQSEAEEEPAPKSAKAKGKKKVKTAEQIQWVREQEPSTKMLWTMAELERMFKENPEGASSLSLLPRRAGLTRSSHVQRRSSSSRRSSPASTSSTRTSARRASARCATRAT